MAELASMGIPGVGMGIIQPNLRYRFRVRFLDAKKNPLAISNQLSSEIMNVSDIFQHRDKDAIPHYVHMSFHDDVKNNAIKGLLELQKLPSFVVAVEMLDGNDGVLRTVYLEEARLHSFTHGDLDYAGCRSEADVTIEGRVPSHEILRDTVLENPVALALSDALRGASFNIKAGNLQYKSSACELLSSFSFSKATYVFPE